MTAAVRVGERRWNLRFDNGIDVQLPEEDPARPGRTWSTAERSTASWSATSRIIDLRLPDRLVAAPRAARRPEDEDARRAQAKDKAT